MHYLNIVGSCFAFHHSLIFACNMDVSSPFVYVCLYHSWFLVFWIFSWVFSCHSCRFIRRPGQPPEKLNRGMILAPLAGIILNLLDASMESNTGDNDMVGIFASMDCPDTVVSGFQYLLEYNWVSLSFT